MRIRFSLRTMLILFTIVTVFIGWRLNQKANLKLAAQRLQERGGTILYRWQSPIMLVNYPITVPDYICTVSVPYEETLPDGSKVIKTRVESAHHNVPLQITTKQFRTAEANRPEFRIASFLLGSHDDVDVSAVSIPAKSVDEDTIEFLHKLQSLENVILEVDRQFYAVKFSRRATAEQREKDLKPLAKNLERATKLIATHLPNVTLYENGASPE